MENCMPEDASCVARNSRCLGESILESRIPGMIGVSEVTSVAQTTTGPARHPMPTSSTPIMRLRGNCFEICLKRLFFIGREFGKYLFKIILECFCTYGFQCLCVFFLMVNNVLGDLFF